VQDAAESATSALPRRIPRWFIGWLALSAVAGLILVPTRFLPLTDLPQIAAQLSILVHFDDPNWGFSEQFELNLATPYLLVHALAIPLVPLFGVVGALRVVIWLAVIAYPLALVPVTRVGRLDPLWALLGFPAAFGFAFWFGFVNFMLVTPLVILFLVALTRYCEEPSRARWIKLSIAAMLLFWAHGLAGAVIGLTTVLMGLTAFTRWNERVRTGVLLVPATVALWLWGRRQVGFIQDDHESIGDWSIGRLIDVPAHIAGLGRVDSLAIAVGVVVLALPFLGAGRPSRKLYRWMPLVAAALLCLALPFKLAGTSFLHQRFAAFLLPGVLLALDGPPRPSRLPYPAIVVLVSAVWLAIVAERILGFDREARSFDQVLAKLEPKRALRPVIIAADSLHVPGGYPFIHFGAYYQAEKGGRLGFSFARNYPAVARYLPHVDRGMAYDAEWHWERYSKEEGPLYDYFLFRAPLGVPRELIDGAWGKLRLVADADAFMAFERVGARAPLAPRRGP